ncbi:MAG: hypothetical protein HeimC2_03230 [Candidatus Heimdallarchaeota archaeon LC_2]|nr:MAG: hypothetical protein HeimC2_03230 [Candidatus Heimdallarchaeota archaeon LC_2]
MALEILTALDFIAFIIESFTFVAIIAYYFGPGTNISKCRSIVVDENILGYWRISLYTQSLSVWLAAIYTFIFPSPSRFLFHLIFYITIIYMLNWVSLPTWVCKTKGYGGMCNCDFYGYNDLTPMLTLSAIGGLIFAFIDLTASQSILMLALLTFFAIIVFFFLPEREAVPLKYPPELLLHSVDELQAFLLENPAEIKLITLLRDTCDFCVIQVDEIARVPKELVHSRLRIFDLSVQTLDPILALTLNLHNIDLSKMPVPSTRIYDQGMEIEIKDGVLSSPEMEQLLNPF